MAGVDNNMVWPSWEELFGSPPDSPGPDPDTAPQFPPTPDEMPGYLQDRLYGGGSRNGVDDQLGWNVGGQPESGPAPDPALAPAGMVVNPYYYLPGNAAYIPETQYNELMQNSAGPQYDAYDATLQTYGDPTKLGYDPGAPWQRENDYYAALEARGQLSRATIGNYVNAPVAGLKGDPNTYFKVSPIPQGYDMRQGDYYQPDGTIGAQNNQYVPIDPAEQVFYGLTPAEKKMADRLGMNYLDYLMSQDVSRSQPRSDAFGNAGVGIGGVITDKTVTTPGYADIFDTLRGMTPSEVTLSDGTVTTDPNPFRGRVGTTTKFMAETGDTPNMYPGVSFYEVGPDGGFKKVSRFEPGKEYFGVRESYDYTGFPMNPTISNAPAGTNFTVRIGDGGSINIADLDPSISLTSVTAINPATGSRKTFFLQDIQDGVFGAPGEIPAGATLVISKASGPEPKAGEGDNYVAGNYDDLTPEQQDFIGQTHPGYSNFVPVVKSDGSVTYMRREDAVKKYGELAEDSVIREVTVPKYDDTAKTYIDPASGKYWFNDGTPAGKWLDKEDYADAKNKQIYYDGKVWIDPVSGKYWVNDGTPDGKWVDRPADEVVPPTPTPKPTSSTTSGTTSAADFNTQMVAYIGSFYGKAGPNGLTYGKSGSIYPEYDDPTLDQFSGKDGWVVPIAESTVGGSVVEIKKATNGKVWVFNPTDKNPNNWDEVSKGEIEPGKRYVVIVSNKAIQDANKKASQVKK